MQVGSVPCRSPGLDCVTPKATSSTPFDPKDTNQDGVVSETEAIAYELKHSTLQDQSLPAWSQYTQNGTTDALGKTPNGALNLMA